MMSDLKEKQCYMTIYTNYKFGMQKIASYKISEEKKITMGQLCGQRMHT